MQTRLSLNHISCERDERILFNGLSYQFNTGALVQITGFNGAGKTTLLHSLCGIRPPATGEILWCERDIYRDPTGFRRSLFYLGHQAPVKGHLTVRENVQWLLALQHHQATIDIESALATVDLEEYAEVQQFPKREGRNMMMMLSPKK